MRFKDIKKTGRSKGINAKVGQRVYTDEDIMQYLKSMADRIGHVPVADEVRHDPDGVSFRTFYDRDPYSFRKWTIKTFGEEKAKRSRWGNTGSVIKYSDEDLELYLQKLSKRLGKIPTSEDIRFDKEGPSFRIWYYRKPYTLKKWLFQVFGKFDREGNHKYTDDDLVEFLKSFYVKYGKIPTTTLLDSTEGYPPGGTYTRRGGINKFLSLAGFKFNKADTYSESLLVERLQKLANDIGKTPTTGDMQRAHKRCPEIYPDRTTYLKDGKTWRDWIKIAALSPVNLLKYTEEELETALKKAGELFGRAMTSKEFDALEGYPPSSHYMRRGGWINWLNRCDLQYTQINNFFGAKVTAKDGHNVKSSEEAQIDDWLFDNNFMHIYEPFYPGQKKYKADFFVNGIYYEYIGLESMHVKYDLKTQKKVEYAKQYNIPLILIRREDLSNLEKIFIKE